MKNNEWKKCHTLSGKAKRFCWRYEKENSLEIKRQFENATREEQKVITNEELNKIHDYVCDNPETGLGNSVTNLDKEGIGKYLREVLGWKKTADFQLASQIAALFVEAKIWKKTNEDAKSRLRFVAVANKGSWQVLLETFYHSSSKCDRVRLLAELCQA